MAEPTRTEARSDAGGHAVLAAIDLGTSRIRLGVLAPGTGALVVLGDRANAVEHGSDGAASCSFQAIWAAVGMLLQELGAWCQAQGVGRVRLALTGQVSSLIRWDAQAPGPVEDRFPIWMDTTCRSTVADLAHLWDGDGARVMLGTCLPAATNWLAVKIRHHLRAHPQERARYLQLQDAVILMLTGALISHPSTQISLVDHRTLGYAPAMLSYLGLSAAQVPTIDPHGHAPMQEAVATRLGLPPTDVHVAPQDTHAALFGLCPRDGDGLLLAGTSEIVGVYEERARSAPPTRVVRARLGAGWMLYGSSASGGATVDWLMRTVLKRTGADALRDLTAQAAALEPGCEGLICLPYLSGERAPLWNAELTASFLGLRAHHGDAHLLRAVLEGVAYARRQAAEALECELPSRFLAAGGGTVSALWNQIRATIFQRPLAVMSTPDLALIGAMRWACQASGQDDHGLRSLLHAQLVPPHAPWQGAYQDGYQRFLAAQHLLDTGRRQAAEASHA